MAPYGPASSGLPSKVRTESEAWRMSFIGSFGSARRATNQSDASLRPEEVRSPFHKTA